MNYSSESPFEKWIFHSYTVSKEGLGLYRIFCALFILYFMMPSKQLYTFLGQLPDDFYNPPPGPMMFFKGFPAESTLLVLHYLLLIALVFMCIGLATKWSSLCVGIVLFMLKGIIFSLGKINHELLLVAVPLVMAFSGWGQAYSVDSFLKTSTRVLLQGWSITLLALLLGFMMFTAGFPKILGGWLNVSSQAAYSHYLKEFVSHDRHDLLAPMGQYLGKGIWEIADYATVIFEVGFLIALIHPKSTRIFVSIAVLFHFATMLLLNISFLPNFIVYAAFLNWSWINNWLTRKIPHDKSSMIRRYGPAIFVALLLTVFFMAKWLFDGFNILQSDWGVAGLLIVTCSVPIAIMYIMKNVYEAIMILKS